MALTPTIARERELLAAIPGGPRLRRREQWGARFSYTNDRPVEHPATRIFIHITITNPRNYSSNDAHARAVESIGISRFPNTGISYNRGVMVDGSPYEFQPMGRRGAHTVNDFQRSECTTSGCPGRGKSLTAPSWNLNVNSRAYVICQNTSDPVSDKQVDTLARIIVADYIAGLITYEAAHNLHGHRCVSSKSCPGNLMWNRMGDLHTKIHYYITNGFVVQPPPPPPDWFDMATKADLEAVIDSRIPTIVQEVKDLLVADKLVRAPNGELWTFAHIIDWLARSTNEIRTVDLKAILDSIDSAKALTSLEAENIRRLLLDTTSWNEITNTWDQLTNTWDEFDVPKGAVQ